MVNPPAQPHMLGNPVQSGPGLAGMFTAIFNSAGAATGTARSSIRNQARTRVPRVPSRQSVGARSANLHYMVNRQGTARSRVAVAIARVQAARGWNRSSAGGVLSALFGELLVDAEMSPATNGGVARLLRRTRLGIQRTVGPALAVVHLSRQVVPPSVEALVRELAWWRDYGDESGAVGGSDEVVG
jgi:hypothetical protein